MRNQSLYTSIKFSINGNEQFGIHLQNSVLLVFSCPLQKCLSAARMLHTSNNECSTQANNFQVQDKCNMRSDFQLHLACVLHA